MWRTQPSSGFAPARCERVLFLGLGFADGEHGPGCGHFDIPMALHDDKAERFVVAWGVLALSDVALIDGVAVGSGSQNADLFAR